MKTLVEIGIGCLAIFGGTFILGILALCKAISEYNHQLDIDN